MCTYRDGKGGKLSSRASKMLYKPPGAVYIAPYKERLDQSDCWKLYVQLWNYTKGTYWTAHMELSLVTLANLQLFTQTPSFAIFSRFWSRETVNVPLLVFAWTFKFSCLHMNFLPKLGKNYENIALRGWPAATTLMADSIRVAQPIRLQLLH